MDNLAEAFDKPADSPEHRTLRESVWLGGAYVECRYYLGMLIGRNEFRTSEDDFLAHLADYITSKTSSEAAIFCRTSGDCCHVVHFLRREFERQTGHPPRTKETKEDRALQVLLTHPDWSDEQIVAEVGASLKSLERWGQFRYARRTQRMYEKGTGR